jgi:hypothetical protein
MYQSGVSIIVYVSIRGFNHSIQGRIHTYTIADKPDSYIHYDWYIWLIHTLWLTHLIHTYTIADTPDSYIHYDWYIWLIHKLSMTHQIDGESIIVYVSIIVDVSIIVNVSLIVYVSIIVDVSLSVWINQGYQSIVYLYW